MFDSELAYLRPGKKASACLGLGGAWTRSTREQLLREESCRQSRCIEEQIPAHEIFEKRY